MVVVPWVVTDKITDEDAWTKKTPGGPSAMPMGA